MNDEIKRSTLPRIKTNRGTSVLEESFKRKTLLLFLKPLKNCSKSYARKLSTLFSLCEQLKIKVVVVHIDDRIQLEVFLRKYSLSNTRLLTVYDPTQYFYKTFNVDISKKNNNWLFDYWRNTIGGSNHRSKQLTNVVAFVIQNGKVLNSFGLNDATGLTYLRYLICVENNETSQETRKKTNKTLAPPPPKLASSWPQMSTFENVEENLMSVLKDPLKRKYFKLFAKKEYSEENVSFWEEVQSFSKEESASKRIEYAHRIIATYFDDNSLQTINTSKWLKNCVKVELALQQKNNVCHQDLFHCVVSDLELNVLGDTFKRFLESQIYQEMKEKSRASAFHTQSWSRLLPHN